MKYTYKTKGTCSHSIEFDIENNIVSNIRFNGGCNGNGKGIAALCENMDAEDIIKRCKGITCGFKNTSCPDQLALALQEAIEKAN